MPSIGRIPFAVVVLLSAFAATDAYSATIFVGAGSSQDTNNPVSGKAQITIFGDTLKLVLTNTTAGGTKAKGDVLSGLIIDITSAGIVIDFPSTGLSGDSTVQTSSTTTDSMAPVSGSWTNDLTSPAYDFGVATAGLGLFDGGSISLGNDGPDYGLVSAATFDTPSYVFDGIAFPFIKDSLTFEFTGATGLSESDISSVVLIFGSEVPSLIDTMLVSEPSSLLIFALLFGGWAAVARFQRQIAAQVHDCGR